MEGAGRRGLYRRPSHNTGYALPPTGTSGSVSTGIMEAMYEYVGPPLTLPSLAALLEEEGVSERAYSLYGAHKEDAIVLDNRPGGWVVFYTERGRELGIETYGKESDACLDLLNRVLKDEHNRFDLVAGPAPPSEADATFAQWLDDRGLRRTDLADRDWKTQDSPWYEGEPDYRRYWVRITRIRQAS